MSVWCIELSETKIFRRTLFTSGPYKVLSVQSTFRTNVDLPKEEFCIILTIEDNKITEIFFEGKYYFYELQVNKH